MNKQPRLLNLNFWFEFPPQLIKKKEKEKEKEDSLKDKPEVKPYVVQFYKCISPFHYRNQTPKIVVEYLDTYIVIPFIRFTLANLRKRNKRSWRSSMKIKDLCRGIRGRKGFLTLQTYLYQKVTFLKSIPMRAKPED